VTYRAVLYPDPDSTGWCAQILEQDIGAAGATLEDAVYELGRVLVGCAVIARERSPVEWSAAPAHFWRMYDLGEDVDIDLGEWAPVPPPPVAARRFVLGKARP
jgi:hypothetical protein